MNKLLKIVFTFFLLNSLNLSAQQNKEELSSIYKESIDEMKNLYSQEDIHFANLINNELYNWFDSSMIALEYRASFIKTAQDNTLRPFDFNKIDTTIKTLSFDYLSNYFYTTDDNRRLKYLRKYLIIFTSPIFNSKKDKCIVCVDFWCGVDCGKIYFIHLEQKNNKWIKTKTEVKLTN